MQNKPFRASARPISLLKTVHGSTLIISLLALTVLALVGAGVLLSVTSRFTGTFQAKSWQEGLAAAEAGSDFGLANCRWMVTGTQAAWTGWKKADGTAVSNPADANTAFAAGQAISYPRLAVGSGNQWWASVQVDAPAALNVGGSQWLRIRSTGYASVAGPARASSDHADDPNATHNNLLRKLDLRFDHFIARYGDAAGGPRSVAVSPQAARRIETIAKPSGGPFIGAIVSNSNFSGSSSGQTDSYDSRDPAKSTNGRYDFAKFQWHGDCHSNATAVSQLPAGWNQRYGKTVYGDVTFNGPTILPGGGVHGNVADNVYIDMPPVKTPTWTTMVVNPVTVTSATTITAGSSGSPLNYKFSKISGALTIQAPSGGTGGAVNIWVTGDITGPITVPAGVTTKIWFEGNMSFKASAMTSTYAANLQFYGVQPQPGFTQTVSIASPGSMYAAIYAPAATVNLSGNSTICGSLMCNGIGGNGSCDIHYDEALGTSSGTVTDYTRVSWVEDER